MLLCGHLTSYACQELMVKVPLNSECPRDVGEVSQGHGSQLWDCAGGDHLQELTGRNVQPMEDYSTIRARNGFT